MKTISIKSTFLFALISLLYGCGPRESESNAEDISVLVIALKPDKNPDAMIDDRELLKAFFEEELGIPVDVRIPASGAVIEQGLANGTIDLAYLSSTSAARFRMEGIADIALAGEIDGNPYYESYWVTLKDKPYDSIEDLRGKPVCFASPTSTSGYIVPAWDLHKRGFIDADSGLEAFFGRNNVLFGTGYVSAIQQVLDGNAEAAAVSDYVIDQEKHLTPEQKSLLRVVQSQGPVPSHVLVTRSNLNEENRKQIKDALLNLNNKNTPLRDRVFGSKLIEVDPEQHLRVTEEALMFASQLK